VVDIALDIVSLDCPTARREARGEADISACYLLL
jgi:hypothetical protein